MSEILDKTRRAFVAYIAAGNVGTTNIYDAKRSGDKLLPNVEVEALNATEDPPGGYGNFLVDVEVTVSYAGVPDADGADPKTAGDALTAAVFALFEIDNESLKAALSGQITAYTVMGFGEMKEQEQSVDGDAWKTKWKRRIYCGGF